MDKSVVSLKLADGTELGSFDNYEINTDIMTPCSGWHVDVGSYHAWRKISGLVELDAKVQVFLDGSQVMTGWIDTIDEQSAGTDLKVAIGGRDHLKLLVKPDLHPNTTIKNLSVADAVLKVLKQAYRTDVPVLVFDNEANRNVLTRKKTKKGKAISTAKQLEQLQPQPGESNFEFLARILRRSGLWMWGTVDGNIVVGKPNYDQPPSYTIQREFGQATSYVKSARRRRDKTNVPSHVFVRGKSAGKGESSSVVQGKAVDPDWTLWAPSYIKHDNVTSAKEAADVAVQELTRHKQGEYVYEVVLKGHKDGLTGAYYAVDTVAHVHDEMFGFDEDLYCASCTWARTGNETTSRLKLIRLGSLIFDSEDV